VTEQDAAPAGGRRTLLPHPGGAGAPPGGQYGLPARSLADGGCHARWPPQSAARRCKEDVRDGAPGGARILERECGITRTMVAPPGAPSPSYLRGTEEGLRRTRRRKETGRRSIGCLKSESVRRTERATISAHPRESGDPEQHSRRCDWLLGPRFRGDERIFCGSALPYRTCPERRPNKLPRKTRKFAWAVSHCPLPVPMFKVATFLPGTAAWLVTRST
jgi:hypothetical protein